MKKERIIIGIDPGYGRVGYGVISVSNACATCISYGCIETLSALALPDRLHSIYNELSSLIKEVQPDCIAVEKLYFTKNVTTGIDVSQARGVILLTARLQGIPIFEFTPLQVKQAATGYGKADKAQLQKMVTLLLRLKKIPTPDDAADALAVALCAVHSPNYSV
jgi:crossover junction endodeoxyribonuclease RuvC